MSDKLIKVIKGGQVMEVHPTALAQHQGLGWAVADDDAKVNAGLETEPDAPETDSEAWTHSKLMKLNKVELIALASEEGLEYPTPDDVTKEEIAKAYLEAVEA